MNTYIIHETSSLSRKNHIDTELSKITFRTKFITDGDKKDIDSTILNKYFDGELIPLNNATSCAYKHFLAYKNMLEDNVDFALILEDDEAPRLLTLETAEAIIEAYHIPSH